MLLGDDKGEAFVALLLRALRHQASGTLQAAGHEVGAAWFYNPNIHPYQE